ncbi:glyoxalase [Kribbella jejuensis]|uniref:Lactoylglutathione lyase n=1 Tax=Kribbella jejuensis TaxID=236068 RepID=A0A542EAQ9_9ACTN|nr:glyoxalase [Kribbella jejuensis]TQJ12412.1 hypothetical protein FB475_5355 [Kribbella jejuensis]
MTTITLDVSDPTAATAFYESFGIAHYLTVRAADVPASYGRSFILSLVVPQPNTVDRYVAAAVAAGATTLKPATKSFWGYGAVIRTPDGAICKIASSAKKDTEPPTDRIDQVALLLGVSDVKASKRFYVEQGLTVAKSFGGKYVEFEGSSGVTLALYPLRALAKDAGTTPTGPKGLALGTEATPFTDPDGFTWETVSAPHPAV